MVNLPVLGLDVPTIVYVLKVNVLPVSKELDSLLQVN